MDIDEAGGGRGPYSLQSIVVIINRDGLDGLLYFRIVIVMNRQTAQRLLHSMIGMIGSSGQSCTTERK
jgi:hypothetical protein